MIQVDKYFEDVLFFVATTAFFVAVIALADPPNKTVVIEDNPIVITVER